MPEYTTLKILHMSLAMISVFGFVLRWSWRQYDSQLVRHRLTRIFPHVVDSFLLLSGVLLAMKINLSPVGGTWLGAKLWGLLAYILLGSAAMKLPVRRAAAVLAFLLALLAFAWMASVAVTKRPSGLFVLPG